MLAFVSSPAFSATGFSFVEYNLAFILGISLPVILINALLSRTMAINWQYPCALTLSLFFILYSLSHQSALQNLILLSSGMLFLGLTYLWPFYDQAKIKFFYKKWYAVIITITCLSYLALLWFSAQINAYFTWLIASTIILTLALTRVVALLNISVKHGTRILIQWFFSVFFVAGVYLWLNTHITENILVIVAVLTYLITIVNGNWLLVDKIYHTIIQQNEDELTQLSADELFAYTHDPVTNLPTYQHALYNAEKTYLKNSEVHYAVIIFQPINFTQVNAILGHQNSDILLLQLAYCLQKKAAEYDNLLLLDETTTPIKIARLQGLKFLIIVDLSSNKHPEKIIIEALCHEFSKAVPTAMSFKSFSLNFELAFGISIVTDHSAELSQAITQAEDALLIAQTEHKKINYFDQTNVLYTEQQLAKMEALKQAIINDTIIWLVHPQVSIATKEVKGFSLDVKWRHTANEHSLALNEFISIAEHSGDIYLLAKKMITKAFQLLQLLHQAKAYTNVAINFSSKLLLEPELISFIEQQSEQFNIAPKYLTIEVSEHIIFTENNRTQQFIDQLRAIKVSIAIINFSGSYDALRFLRKILISHIKISCAKLDENNDYTTNKAIVNALLNLASTMNIPLIGTHVDNKAIAVIFAEIGGKYAEGKLISDGIAIEKITAWLKKWTQLYGKSRH
jgi:predicted signal transduction protein with EAL and GGDEF domain